jgi:hypothetical protein
MMWHDSAGEKDRDSGLVRVDDGEQVAGRAQYDRQCPGPGGLVRDQGPRAKGIARELAQAQEEN